MGISNKISEHNRSKKYKYFTNILYPNNKTTILDVGFTDNDYSKEANYLEKHYPYLSNITALGISPAETFKKKFPQVKVFYMMELFSLFRMIRSI